MEHDIKEIETVNTLNYEELISHLKDLSESEFNQKIIEAKRSIAEICKHIFQTEWVPKFLIKSFYLMLGMRKRSGLNPVDASDYEFKPIINDEGNMSDYSLEKALKKAIKYQAKTSARYVNPKESEYWFFHIMTRHIRKHVKQVTKMKNVIRSE